MSFFYSPPTTPSSQYHLVGVDRDSEETVISTANCTTTSKVTQKNLYVDGHLLDRHLLYCKIEYQFQATSSVTFSSTDNIITITGYKLGGSYFLWHDIQAYIDYSTLRPMGLYNDGNNLVIRFRGSMPTYTDTRTLRLTFVTYVDKV